MVTEIKRVADLQRSQRELQENLRAHRPPIPDLQSALEGEVTEPQQLARLPRAAGGTTKQPRVTCTPEGQTPRHLPEQDG